MEDYILTAHRANLEPEALIARKNFDDRFAAYCSDIFRAFSNKADRPNVLSLGCGLGLDAMAFSDLGYDAYDIEIADMVDIWRNLHGENDARLAVSPTGQIPFGNQKFDLIVSFNVLEHVGTIPPKEIVTPSTQAARQAYVSQAVDRLADNGVFVLIAPNKSYILDYGHNHWYGIWKYINGKKHIKCGWSLTNPFDKNNFLPSIEDIHLFCQEVNKSTPISLYLFDDYSLLGYPVHKAIACFITRFLQYTYSFVKGNEGRFYVNNEIQTIIVKEKPRLPSLNDFVVEDSYGKWTWKRRGFSNIYNAEMRE